MLHEPTNPILRGSAFARAMEQMQVGADLNHITIDGYTFYFTGDFTIEHYPQREMSAEKNYGGIVVSARCDRILGKVIVDDKTTERFDAEKYWDQYQWSLYLDIFGADKFIWNVWEVKKMNKPKSFCVNTLHLLSQYRYPAMERDCRDLAQEYKEFAERYLRGRRSSTQEGRSTEMRVSVSNLDLFRLRQR